MLCPCTIGPSTSRIKLALCVWTRVVERAQELRDGIESIVREPRERTAKGRVHLWRKLRTGRPCARRFLVEAADDDGPWVGRLERRQSSQHLIKDAAHCVDVSAMIELPPSHCLFRAHVQRGAKDLARVGHPLIQGHADCNGHAEIHHDGAAVGEKDIFRFHITVNDAVHMRPGKGIPDIVHDR